jgi:hypothetical protein
MANFDYRDLKASVFLFCNTLRNELEGAGLSPDITTNTMDVYNFDAHADNVVLPDRHIVGVRDFSLVDDTTIEIECTIGLGFKDDTNLFKLDAGISRALNKLRPGKRIPLVEADNGTQYGLLTSMSGLTVFPVDRTRVRPIQFLGVRLATDSLEP